MQKLLTGILVAALFMALPLLAQAAPLGYQGTMSRATVRIDNNGTVQTLVERSTSKMSNMSLMFDNMSGIVSKGQMSFDGMWIGFGGTALTPAPTAFRGVFQSGGSIKMTGDVSYDMATNKYTGNGTVIEFVGTMALSGTMKQGWCGQYGTPGAGPGGGWMPGWGSGTAGGGMMPGWGGSSSGWGMMGGYGPVSPKPGGGYMAPGGGMMGGGVGMMGASGMMGGGGGGMPGRRGGGTPGNVGGTPVKGKVGMVMLWVTPTTAAIIPVNNGTPDHTNPTPVYMKIMLPAVYLTAAP